MRLRAKTEGNQVEIVRVDITPLSVNRCWQGKRFKTKDYGQYERDVLLLLPKFELPDKPYRISFEFGMSNKLSDVDNPIKPLLDILQKKYGFNDRDVHEISAKKLFVVSGQEYFTFRIETFKQEVTGRQE